MPAATPQEAATNREQNTVSGIAKYRAKLQQMHANFSAGPPVFTHVEELDLLSMAKSLLPRQPAFTSVEDVPLLPVASVLLAGPPAFPPAAPPPVPTAQALEAFLDDRRLRGCRPNTLRGLRATLARYLQGQLRVPADPGPARHLLAGYATLSTRGEVWARLNTFHSWLEAEYQLPNPMARVARHRAEVRRPDHLSPEQRRQLDGHLENGGLSPRDRALVWLFSEVGPRPGEIADPADHLLRFVDIHGDHMEIEGKVGPRAVPISPGLRQALLGLRGGRPLDDPVFLDDRCTHYLTVSGLRRSVRRVMEGAGIRGVKLCPYTLRHSVGTQAVEDGTDLDVVQRVLGHRSINTTMKYRHISGAQVKAAWKRGKGEPDFCAKSAPAAHRG